MHMQSAKDGNGVILEYFMSTTMKYCDKRLTSTSLPANKIQYKNFVHDLQSKNRRVYFVNYNNNGAVSTVFLVLQGDYDSLTRLRYKNKTEARRDIQKRIRDVEVDMQAVKSIQDQLQDSEYYISNANVQNVTNRQHKHVTTKIKRQHDKLKDALFSPTISYRAYPILYKKQH